MSARRRISAAAVLRAQKALERLQEGLKARLCTPADIDLAVQLYKDAAREARRLGKAGQASAVVDGGAVPNAYAYAAETTRITVGGGVIAVERMKARRAAGGDQGLRLRVVPCPDGMSAAKSGIEGARKYAGLLRW